MSERLSVTEEEPTRTSWAERSEKLKQTGKSIAISLMIAVTLFAPIHAAMKAETLTQFNAAQEMQQTMGDMLEGVGEMATRRRENIEVMEQISKAMNEVKIEGAVGSDGYGYNVQS